MNKITYVSGNYGKNVSVREYFAEREIDIDILEHDFIEPEINDIEAISRAKVIEAYNLLNTPCFVSDTGFYIDNYPNNPGYPGAFVKRSNVSSDIDGLLEVMKDVTDRQCRFVDCLTFYDGTDFYVFYGISAGTLSYEARGQKVRRAKSNLWYVFIPDNCSKTLGEMSDEERKTRPDGHTSATEEFVEWYKKEYSAPKVKQIKNKYQEN